MPLGKTERLRHSQGMKLSPLFLALLLPTASLLHPATHADVPLTPSPTTVVGEAWAAWKSKIPSWTTYMPGAMVFKNLGRAQDNLGIGWQKAKNFRAFDRYCGFDAPYAQQPFCMAMKPAVRATPTAWFAHAPLWLLLDNLIARAGPANAAGQDAAKLLLAIRMLLDYPATEPSHPDRLVGLLYTQFANCVPTSCQVAVTRPAGMQQVMRGLILYFETYGGETDLAATKLLRQAGF